MSEITASLSAAGFDIGSPRQSTLAVLDTFDGRIAAARLRLTLVDGRRLVLGGSGVPASVRVTGAPRTAADVPPGPMRQRLAGLLDVRVLIRLLEISSTVTTATRRNANGKITATVAIHERPAAAGLAPPVELVAELGELAGYAKQAAAAADTLTRAGLEPTGVGLIELAAETAGVSLTGYAVPIGVPLDPQLPAIDGFRAVLANLRDAIVVNWDGAVADVDTEFLHDLRVGVRRTRTALANARRVIPDDVRGCSREDFAWLGAITGPARDLDVYRLEWPEYTAHLDDRAVDALEPLREHLDGQRHSAHLQLSDELTGPRANGILEQWSQWLDAPLDRAGVPDRASLPVSAVAAKRIRRAHRLIVDAGRAITPQTPAGRVHELRILAKKLRYLVECFGGLYAPAARRPFVARLKMLQDLLGEYQDTEVHATHLRQYADASIHGATADTMVAIGQLVERFERRRQACRAQVEERFAAFDTAKTRRALDKMLSTAGT